MEDKENSIVDYQKKLICSDAFEKALASGSERNIEIDGTLKSRSKSNYETFFDIMLRSRTDIQSILDKKKKQRTAQENEALAAFKRTTSLQYKQLREIIFIDEDESLDEDGVTAPFSKKLVKLVDNIANVTKLLKYIGHSEFEGELAKRGISLSYTKLEDESECFENDAIRESVVSVFDSACNIQKDINTKKREITDEVFPLAVPTALQYDKDMNPSGIKPSDFNKLVQLQTKKIKALSEEAKDKFGRQATTEAENKHYDSIRNEVLREKYMALMDDDEGGSVNV